MKKSLIILTVFFGLVLGILPVKAEMTKKKVQTNYQYKLVCGYYNGSNELTWGSQENIGDYLNEDGSESNSNRACGTTTATKNFTLGDPSKNNLPKDVEMIYDSCNGSTGKQKAKAGQKCTNPGKIKTCSVKWVGYCYKDPNAKSTTKTITKKTSSKRFTLTESTIKVGETTEIKNVGVCYDFEVEDDDILKYNSADDSFTGLSEGKTYIRCLDKDGEYLSRKYVKVKTNSKNKATSTNYRYVNRETDFYKNANLEESNQVVKEGRKVKYLNVKINGYCKIKLGGKTGYVSCDNLDIEAV